MARESDKKGKGPTPRSKKLLALTILGCVLSMSILAYNMDEIYLAGHDNATLYVPGTMLSDVDNTILVMATDEEGNALANEPVSVYLVTDNGTELMYKGETGEDGTVQPVIRPPPSNHSVEIEVRTGRERVRRTVNIEDTIKILISTDKPIYQPGQVVHIRTLAFEGEPAIASERRVIFEIDSPAGDTIFRETVEADEYGIANLDFDLATILPLGYYKVKAFVGTEMQTSSFLVKRYVLPKFRIDIQGLRTWYTADEDINATVSCEYFFGKKVEGSVSVKANTYYGYWEEVYTDTGTLANGEFDLFIPRTEYAVGLPWNDNNGYLAVNVTVRDEAGHVEEKSVYVSVSRSPIVITALSDLNVRGVQSQYYILARYPDGIPVPNAAVNYGFDYAVNQVTTTDERGIALLEFEYRGLNRLRISVEKDGLSTVEHLYLTEHRGIKVVGSSPRYELGETAHFDVYYSGDSLTTITYYEVVSKGFVLQTGRFNLAGGIGSIDLAVTSSMVPLCEVRVFKVERDLTITGDTAMFGVGEIADLNVTVGTDQASYRPRDDVKIDFTVTGRGLGVPSALGVSIVDQAVFELNSKYEGFESLMFEMDASFATPQYQIIDYIFTDKGITALPTNTTTEISLTSGKDSTVTSTWATNLVNAIELRDTVVEGYWTVLTLMLLVGYFALIAIGYKRRVMAALGVGALIAVPGVLYVMTTGYGGTGGVDGGLEQWGGEDVDGMENAAPAMMMMGFSNGTFRDEGTSDTTGGTATPTVVRQYFPETWYWNPTVITDRNGQASLTLQAPDSITSWKVEATASTKDAQFGLGSGNVTVFQEFFIEPDIPVSVIRGDEFPLKILIYNYLNTSSDVSVLLGADEWYNTTEPLIKSVTVEPNSVGFVEYAIRTEIIGWHEVNVLASTSTLSDAVTRPIYVEPDGKEVITTYAGQLEDDDLSEVTIELDDQPIPFSTTVNVKLEAGMDSVVLEGAEKYIHFVSGCGEQSMSTLAVDILAFDVIDKTSADLDLMEYETMVTQGIQHELTFLMEADNGIGRGIVWFPSDQDVHPWLTSWGLITFKDAQMAGFALDDAILTDMQDWLVSQQDSDGSYKFPDWGIYETNNPILKSKKLATTAYITRALLYSGYDADSRPITEAVSYILDNREEAWDDPYTLALCLIVLDLAEESGSVQSEMVVQLDYLKKEDNGTYYWASDTNMISESSYRWGGGCNARVIETTAYAMMALFGAGGYQGTVSGAREYMLAHRSNLGGFFSTQDTVVALQALRSVSDSGIETVDVDVYMNDMLVDTVRFTDATSHLAAFVDLTPYLNHSIANVVRMESAGTGRVYYTVTRSQYLPWAVLGIERPPELELTVTYDSTNIKVDDTIAALLTMEYLGSANMLKMILVDVRAPAGFAFVAADLDAMVQGGKISSYELADRQALLYVTDVYPNQPLTLDYHLRATMPIKGTIQGVKAFDMYDPDLTAEVGPVEVEVTEP